MLPVESKVYHAYSGADNKILLIGNIVEQEFTMAYDWHLGSGLSLVLMVFIVINMAVTAYFDRSEGQVKK